MNKPIKANKLYYIVLRPILKFLYFVLYHPKYIHTENIPPQGRILLAGNHVNVKDPCNVLCSTKRHVYFLAKSELFVPWYSFVFKSAGCISVDCDHKSHDSTEKAIEQLNDDEAVGIFPEGQVKKDPSLILQPFKNGVIKMAKETDSLIVPFAIIGKYKLFFNNLKVVYGKPVDVKDMSYEEANKFLFDTIYKLIVENSNEN